MGLVKLLRRIAVTVLGVAILAVGAVLLVAPGPGVLVILVALVVLALEYEWARRHLDAVRARARITADRAAGNPLTLAATALFGLSAVGLGTALMFTDSLPLSGPLTGISVAVAGLTVLATLAYSVWEARRARRTTPGA